MMPQLSRHAKQHRCERSHYVATYCCLLKESEEDVVSRTQAERARHRTRSFVDAILSQGGDV
jgi:hypothetical protein